ncbi:MAG TPA: glutamyl-tRNA amidotransferase [Phycisphaerae bacterium]|nr:glutamyl-tRNA amidotransferase [Phycisphaerae bacterium]
MILAVNGTLMRGLKLNNNLLEVGAVFVREEHTAPCYRMWSIDDNYPAMQRDDHGSSLSLELWSLETDGLMSILIKEPPGLALGKISLADGSTEFGVLGEASICQNQKEITSYGGWREYCDRI